MHVRNIIIHCTITLITIKMMNVVSKSVLNTVTSEL